MPGRSADGDRGDRAGRRRRRSRHPHPCPARGRSLRAQGLQDVHHQRGDGRHKRASFLQTSGTTGSPKGSDSVSLTVCVSGRGNLPPVVGGHLWVYLNWALGLRALGCRVIWLEVVDRSVAPDATRERAAALRSQLEGFGLAQSLALEPKVEGYLDLDAAAAADLVLDLGYCAETEMVRRFRKSALVDIDPGLTQCWISEGQMALAPHAVYFTIGETVGTPAARFPDCGLRWHYTPPPVFIPAWSP